MTAAPERISRHGALGGMVEFCRHAAEATGCEMRCAVYLPPQAERRRVPLLWYLAGLTCTEGTFMIRAGAQRTAAELGLALAVLVAGKNDAKTILSIPGKRVFPVAQDKNTAILSNKEARP